MAFAQAPVFGSTSLSANRASRLVQLLIAGVLMKREALRHPLRKMALAALASCLYASPPAFSRT